MNDIAVRVDHLSKLYNISAAHESYTMFRDVLTNAALAPYRRLRSVLSRQSATVSTEPLWALKDVSFEVKRGEVVGIIGRNGAGKSTLLKILSRITAPSEGRATIYGRVGSLLEVGTGFHPELTGRENVYLNGAILGMTRREISQKLDQIIDFAEIEKFLDTPVKRYSSGMYMRLAFAVAAHLEPEILIVDEVLAVGDAAFQKKCLGKMSDAAYEGRTVLFVSHNMAAVENLCQRGIVLSRGQVSFAGTQSEAINHYLRGVGGESQSLRDRTDRSGSGQVRITAIEVRDTHGQPLQSAASGQDIDLYIHYEKSPDFETQRVVASINVKTQMDVPVFLQHNRLTGDEFGFLPDSGAFVCRIARLPLPPATYWVAYAIMLDHEFLDRMTNAVSFDVIDGDFYGTGEVPPVSHGVSLVQAGWRLVPAHQPIPEQP